jgi:hypothetical protein
MKIIDGDIVMVRKNISPDSLLKKYFLIKKKRNTRGHTSIINCNVKYKKFIMIGSFKVSIKIGIVIIPPFLNPLHHHQNRKSIKI